MRNLPVHWHEGMFLRPQHFQSADRHWAENLKCASDFDHPFNYGLYSIHFSKQAITDGEFELRACAARMRDGTTVVIGEGEAPLRVNVSQPLQNESSAMIYLAVPKADLGAVNVRRGEDPGTCRWRESILDIQDESCGSKSNDIHFKKLASRLLTGLQDPSGYETLPIARLVRGVGGVPQLDTSYVPPMLSMIGWQTLHGELFADIYHEIGKNLAVISAQVIAKPISFYSQEPGDLEHFFMLQHLNTAYTSLAVLVAAERIHPFLAYTELCRIIGQLSIYADTRRAEDVRAYDHDNLADIFRWARDEIHRLIEFRPRYDFDQVPFVGSGPGLRVTIDQKWFQAEWEWYVGCAPEGINATECRDMLSPGVLDWKLGSEKRVGDYFRSGAPGLQLQPIDQPPRVLPGGKWNYYKVHRDNQHAWQDVLITGTLAMRLNEKLILNRNELQNQQKLLVSFRAKHVKLEFALFAVRTHQ